MMEYIAVINIIAGVGLCGWGMYDYLQNPEKQIVPIPHVKDWHISLGIGAFNLAWGIFLIFS